MSNRSNPTGVVPSTFKPAGKSLKVKSNAHVVQVDADYACWDTTSNKFVNPEDTNLKDPA